MRAPRPASAPSWSTWRATRAASSARPSAWRCRSGAWMQPLTPQARRLRPSTRRSWSSWRSRCLGTRWRRRATACRRSCVGLRCRRRCSISFAAASTSMRCWCCGRAPTWRTWRACRPPGCTSRSSGCRWLTRTAWQRQLPRCGRRSTRGGPCSADAWPRCPSAPRRWACWCRSCTAPRFPLCCTPRGHPTWTSLSCWSRRRLVRERRSRRGRSALRGGWRLRRSRAARWTRWRLPTSLARWCQCRRDSSASARARARARLGQALSRRRLTTASSASPSTRSTVRTSGSASQRSASPSRPTSARSRRTLRAASWRPKSQMPTSSSSRAGRSRKKFENGVAILTRPR
mmetsp:Transcript_42615/g.127878  ORF Transcript_42615/g.127878 Transcript_42615/m.127878 type:complete len:346 (+) Transcript_42615:2871-3908(+)